MTQMKNQILLFAALSAAALSGCALPTAPNQPANVSGTVYMWIAPVADTKIDADHPDDNFYKSGDNTYARAHIPGTVAWYAKSFVKFQLPHLPAGTKIDEVYFEMFHSGTTEDGTEDNTRFNVSPVGRQWRADSITWNNSPDMHGISSGVNPWGVTLHSNDWCGTTNIANTISPWFDDSTQNTGFRIELGDYKNYKSFYSNNSFIGARNSGGRTDSTLGKAPRLLVKIELPPGKSMADLQWSTLLPDSDVTPGLFTQTYNYVLMARWVTGATDFPADWGAKKGQ
jgi:hypothetical protein